MTRFAPYVVAIAAFLGCMWWAYGQGVAKCQADHDAEWKAMIEAGEKLEAQRIAEAQKRDELIDELKEQANADPIVVERCAGPDRVRRLNQIR